jgi:hypothetical protein
MEWDAITVGASALVLLNVMVSLKVVLAKTPTGTQKILQGALVWLVPVLGAILVYLVHRSDNEPRGPAEPPLGGGAHDGMPGGVQ